MKEFGIYLQKFLSCLLRNNIVKYPMGGAYDKRQPEGV